MLCACYNLALKRLAVIYLVKIYITYPSLHNTHFESIVMSCHFPASKSSLVLLQSRKLLHHFLPSLTCASCMCATNERIGASTLSFSNRLRQTTLSASLNSVWSFPHSVLRDHALVLGPFAKIRLATVQLGPFISKNTERRRDGHDAFCQRGYHFPTLLKGFRLKLCPSLPTPHSWESGDTLPSHTPQTPPP